MTDPSIALQRWHALDRADRTAILARLTDSQRSDLMTMIAAEREHADADVGSAREASDGWLMFSAGMGEALRAIAAGASAAPASYRLTPATAALLLETANEMRAEWRVDEGWAAGLRRRWQNWRKELGL